MKSILIPTDFSFNANKALECAVEIAALTNSDVELLHIYTPIVSKTNIVSAFLTDEVGDVTKEALEKLNVISTTIKNEYPQINCKNIVKVGEPVEEILEVAKEDQIDLIIMGTLGASNLSKMIFGSNTASVIEQSQTAVLAVPINCDFHPPKKILFATDLSLNDLKGLEKLTQIAAAFKSEIILGHVDVSMDEESEVTQEMENFLKQAKALTKYEKISFKLVSDHNVSMGLDKIIEEGNIDLFALSTHKRTWFEKLSNPSLTKKISHYTSIPLLAFHND
jgi:nucleotide-binding universal stress UspA family protein